jgi:hypothetical protein
LKLCITARLLTPNFKMNFNGCKHRLSQVTATKSSTTNPYSQHKFLRRGLCSLRVHRLSLPSSHHRCISSKKQNVCGSWVWVCKRLQ